MDILKHLMSLDTLDDLSNWVKTQNQDELRTILLTAFDQHIEYKNIAQWAQAVRLCEALAITGWGQREALDAVSYTGAYSHSEFVTLREEYRFKKANWKNQKAGWIIFNPHYYYSPDFPNKPTINWLEYSHEKHHNMIEPEKLPSQRNSRKKMPIRFSGYGGENEVTATVSVLINQLSEHLYDSMRPDFYGDAINKFYFGWCCPALDDEEEPHLGKGILHFKRHCYDTSLYFDSSFTALSLEQQKHYISHHLLEAIDLMSAKLTKRRAAYNSAAFKQDVAIALQKWQQQQDL